MPLSKSEKLKLQTLAKEFGFGSETIQNQFKVSRNTEGFRKLYCGGLSQSTSEAMLQTYFSR